ncbi:MAG: hypothetical protein HYX77_09285 [Acidobacteria bacterium]|nr:hypothetical protein [Acidobacteriota bacterium]
MKYRWLILLGAFVVIVAVASVPLAGQAPGAGTSTAGSSYSPPRTAWGDPDLQVPGVWRGLHKVPFERPPELQDREFRTDAEVAALEAEGERRNALRLSGKQENRGDRNQPNYNSIVGYQPDKIRYSKRTSAIIDPPDGRLPPWTLEQVKHYEAREAATLGRGDSDSWFDRPAGERCIPIVEAPVLGNFGMANSGRTAGAAETPGTVNLGEGFSNNASPGGVRRFLQAPGYVAITFDESITQGNSVADYRIVPLDGRPHLGPKFKQWRGDVRGHWEGNTLVVETTNIKYPSPIITSYGGTYPGDGETLRFTERFTRVGPDTIEYRYTVDDPAVYTRPYTVLHELTRDDTYKVSADICHEGHDDMPSSLAGGRLDEENAMEGAKDTRLEREPRIRELKEEAIRAAAQKQGSR